MEFIKNVLNMILVKEENQSLKKDLNYQKSLLRQEIAKSQIQRRGL